MERAKGFRLCLRRIWAFSAWLPGRENSLPGFIPASGRFSVPSHNRQHHEHEQCTFDFCEHSRIDFTSVVQLHEGHKGSCGYYKFPLDQLIDRVDKGRLTAWKVASGGGDDAPSLLGSTQPYMAISHVWADGTGAGMSGPGIVNKCLYDFFSGIARDFQCEGCWWDAISIPRDAEARSRALNLMQNNYASARITLVHDLYLRQWEWTDAETACFALVMSPWYSRGWTALELAKSHKVKILFKARNDQFIIKDLDVDILAEVSPYSPYYATAVAIRKLRGARIQSLGDLLSILGPRDTSKPRDVPIISGLLAGVDVSGDLSQQEIYQRILRKLGKVAQAHLFHNSATMAAPGFSWCPTNVLDMPMADVRHEQVLLELHENGDLEGTWRAYPADSIKFSDFIWQSTHALTHASLKSALTRENRDEHILLAEPGPSRCQALLVRPMVRQYETTGIIYCRFVGPVYFRSPLGSSGKKDDPLEGRDIKVRISNTEKMREGVEGAWRYVLETIEELKAADGAATTGGDSGDGATRTMLLPDEDDAGLQDSKALLVLGTSSAETLTLLFNDSARFPSKETLAKSSDEAAMFCLHDQNRNDSSTSIPAFFYGNQRIIPKVKNWVQSPAVEVETGKLMLLYLDENMKIKVDSGDFPARVSSRLGGQALQLVTEKAKDGKFASLVTLLLDGGAEYRPNDKGQWPIHSAVENANVEIVRSFLTNEVNPADPNAENADSQAAIHLAAKKGQSEIAQLLVEKMEDDELNARDKNGQTALVVAASEGRSDIIRVLLAAKASTDLPDYTKHIALHYAAQGGHDECVSALLKHAEDQCRATPESAPVVATENGIQSAGANSEGAEGDTDGEPRASDGDGDRHDDKPLGERDSEQTLDLKRIANLEVANAAGMTALLLASQEGKSEVVQILLRYGANPCPPDSRNQTALILAARHGKAETVRRLLRWQAVKWKQEELNGALLSAAAKLSGKDKDKASFEEVINQLLDSEAKSGPPDSEGMTALHWAVKVNNETIAKRLIIAMTKGDRHLNATDNKPRQSALLMAVDSGMDDTVTALLAQDAEIDSKDSRKRTALHWAVVRGNFDVVSKLLKIPEKRIVDDKDLQGRTALHLAARSGEPKITAELLRANADFSALDNDGQTALMLAAEYGRGDALDELLRGGANPATRDDAQRSALDWASTKGFNDVVIKLLASPRLGDDDDKAKKKALELAAKEGHLQVSITLYDHIKNSRLRESAVPTVLFSAAAAASHASLSPPIIDRLMKMVVDPNCRDKDKRTALMLAVLNEKGLLLEKLLGLGADPDLQDNKKRTALMMACESDEGEFVELLLQSANADPNIQDEQGYTALHYAAERGYLRIVVYLFRYMRLGHTPNANIQDNRKRTALHIAIEKLQTEHRYAVYSRHHRFVRRRDRYSNVWHFLLQSGARPDIKDANGQTPLHWAVRRNRGDIFAALLNAHTGDNSASLDTADAEGRTPLFLAAERTLSQIVEELAHRYHFKPDSPDIKDRTPLLVAAEGGDDDSVRSLLSANANPNLADTKSRTPLLQAARNGYLEVVRCLTRHRKTEPANPRGRDRKERVNLDARDDRGQTALMLAAENGYDEIVAELLGEGANSSLIDYEGKKAWQRAMDNGHAAIVDSLLSKLDAPTQDMSPVNEALLLASWRGWIDLVDVLLKQEADVAFQSDSNHGRTALHMAARGGHVEVVDMLLKKGVGVVIKDNKGRTALLQATEHGFESIVNLLLKQPSVSSDIVEWMGPEALRCAAEKGYPGIVASLLLTGKVDRNGVDAAHRTAMALAAANGNQEIVDILLGQDADPNLKDSQQRAALHHAAWGGHDAVVTSLLRQDVEINAVDDGKQAALHLAAERASLSVVSLLLANGANANATTKDGQTALHRAAWGGSCDVVKLLRKKGADPSARDIFNNKPWQVAAEKGHESIVKALLDEEVNIKDEPISKVKGLIFASQRGYTAMANALLSKGAEVLATDLNGLTALHWVAKRGDHTMVELLIKQQSPNKTLDLLDLHQQTPLCLAVQQGRATVVRILLENGADPNIPGEQGQTVLHIAAAAGNGEIVQILDNHKADPHARDHQRQKAWFLAAEKGYHLIVRLLLRREVDLNPQSQKMEELFLKMAAKGYVLMVGLLLQEGVNKDATDRLGRVAIGLAAEQDKDNVVEHLLKAKANPSVPDSNRQTPLLWAAKSGNLRILKLLLDSFTSMSSVDPDESPPALPGVSQRTTLPNGDVPTLIKDKMLNHTDSEGRTALLIAIQNMKPEKDQAVRLLLREGIKHGMNVDLTDTKGRTALHLVAEAGQDSLVKLLLQHDADQNIQDQLGRTALFLAAEHGHTATVEALLDQPFGAAEVDMRDIQGRTALHVAAEQGHTNMARKLLDRSAAPDLQDSLGRTPLLLAAENGERDVVAMLLAEDARQDLADSNGRTPLLLAVANGDRAIVKALLDHPLADMAAIDSNQRSLLHRAVQSGSKEVAWLVAEQMTQLQGVRTRDEAEWASGSPTRTTSPPPRAASPPGFSG